jgi:hypothetical protein
MCGSRRAFTVKLSLSTYVLGDLALAFLVKGVGPSRAGPLWTALVFLSLPASLAYFARSLRLSSVRVGNRISDRVLSWLELVLSGRILQLPTRRRAYHWS